MVAETLCSFGTAQTLLVTGTAGVGKSVVVEAGRQTAVREGVRVLRLRWESAEGEQGASALADAVCRILTKIQDGRVPARITDIRREELRATDGDGGLALLAAMGRVLADAAHHVPFAMVVDDIDRMVPATASALAMLLRAFRPAGLPVVMAGRTGLGSRVEGELRAAADRVLDVEPLKSAAVHDLVQHRFGRPVDAEVTEAVIGCLGPLHGNPRAVLSVLEALKEDDGLLEVDGWLHLAVPVGRLRLGGSFTELCRAAWPGPQAEREQPDSVLEVAHLVGTHGLGLESLHRMARWAPDRYPLLARVVDRLVVDGVLVLLPTAGVAFAVPAFGTALRALPTPSAVQSAHAGIVLAAVGRSTPSAAGSDDPRLADHAAAAGALVAGEIAAPLLLAAAAKCSGYTTDHAMHAYLAALRSMPRHHPDRACVLRKAAELGLRNPDYAGTVALGELLADRVAAPGPEDGPDLEGAVLAWGLAALFQHLSPDVEGQPWAAVLGTPVGAELAVLARRYGIGTVVPGPHRDPSAQGGAAEPGGARDSRAREADLAVAVPGSGLLPPAARLRLLAAAAGGPSELEAVGRDPAAHGISATAWDGMAAAAAFGDLAGAVSCAFSDSYLAVGDSVAVRYHAMVRAYLAGDWARALLCARRIEARGRTRGTRGASMLVRVLAAEMHLTRGELGLAQAWMSAVPETVAHPLAGRVRVGVRYRLGRTVEAYEEGWRDVRRARSGGLLQGLDQLLLRIFHCGVQDGASEVTHRAVAELEELYEESGSQRAGESLLMARSVLRRDVDGAVAALRLVQDRGDRPLALLCHEWVAMLSDDARPWLSAAIREAQAMGIRHIERSPFGRAARVDGLKLRLPRQRRPKEEMSARDLHLVAMLSDGATNRQIAGQLTCSEKTVEQHLTRLFKLAGCCSRAELVAAWLEGSLSRLGLPPDTAKGVGGDRRSR